MLSAFRIVLTKATPGFAGGLKELIARKKVNKKKSPRWVRNGLPTRLTTTRRLIHDKVSS